MEKEKGNTAMIALIVIVALVVIGGLAYYMTKNSTIQLKNISDKDVNLPIAPQAPVVPTPPPSDFTNTDSSDESIDSDLQKIDAQAKNLNGDSANIDQSLNDKPLNISE
jgi:hypothetical protein